VTVALFLQEFGFSVADLLAGVVNYAYYILFGCIIASILFSWFPSYPSSGFMQAVYDGVRAVTNPILWPIRSRIPMLRIGGFGLDLSPIIAIFGLSIARRLLLIIIAEFIQPVTG
jgi:YggT family protein